MASLAVSSARRLQRLLVPPDLCGFVSSRRFNSSNAFDLVVLGGGPGGYVAAIKAAQLGLKTACVEGRGTLGGTCLNVGCIPSKALLNISHKYHELIHDFPKCGIETGSVQLNLEQMMGQKQKSVKGLTEGIEFLFKRNKVEYIKGWGKLKTPTLLEVGLADNSGSREVTAKNIIIATGSEPSPMPGGALVADEKVIVTSTGCLCLERVPSKMLVIGGGVIGLELGSVWNRLGAEVEVVEFLDRICPALDGEISKAFQKSLEKQGMQFRLSTKVVSGAVANGVATVEVEKSTGEKEALTADIVLLAVGRKPTTQNIGLESLGIPTDKGGRIVVDAELRIPQHPNIRAIGDVIPGPMLAHKAEEEGIAAAEHISGSGAGHINYDAIPSVIYTHPEVAGVGATEEELKAQGRNYTKGVFPFAANSRARTNDSFEGMVKVLTDKQSDKILGAWLLGPNVGELIGELVLGMEYGASSEDIARTCHAHPTLSEAVKEACMLAHGKAIHFG